LTLLEVYKRAGFDQLRLLRESPFRVASLLIDAVLHRANRDLLWLSERLGFGHEAEIAGWLRASQEGIESLWDEEAGLYFNRDLRTGEAIRVGVSASFLPLYAGTASPARALRLLRTLEDWAQQVHYLVPSTDPRSPRFEPQRYWRGPVWAEMAERIRQDTLKLCEVAGFSEYFHPLSGQGLGGGAFSWTAAIYLVWR
jgi:alpha,alpha-trehalase